MNDSDPPPPYKEDSIIEITMTEYEKPVVQEVPKYVDERVLQEVPKYVEERVLQEVPKYVDERVLQEVPKYVDERVENEISVCTCIICCPCHCITCLRMQTDDEIHDLTNCYGIISFILLLLCKIPTGIFATILNNQIVYQECDVSSTVIVNDIEITTVSRTDCTPLDPFGGWLLIGYCIIFSILEVFEMLIMACTIRNKMFWLYSASVTSLITSIILTINDYNISDGRYDFLLIVNWLYFSWWSLLNIVMFTRYYK
jgi:hypothetical protein